MGIHDLENETLADSDTDTRVQRPSLYNVLLANDDYTPMDFVVHIIMKFFRKNKDVAMQLMMQVHTEGKAVVGKYTLEIAETKSNQVTEYARKFEYPLLCTFERD